MTLEKFLEKKPFQGMWVDFPGFSHLYVRWDKCRHNTVMLASMTAKEPGNGAFTRLMEFLPQEEFNIYVECVLSERFALKLEALGFERLDSYGLNPNFYLESCDQCILE